MISFTGIKNYKGRIKEIYSCNFLEPFYFSWSISIKMQWFSSFYPCFMAQKVINISDFFFNYTWNNSSDEKFQVWSLGKLSWHWHYIVLISRNPPLNSYFFISRTHIHKPKQNFDSRGILLCWFWIKWSFNRFLIIGNRHDYSYKFDHSVCNKVPNNVIVRYLRHLFATIFLSVFTHTIQTFIWCF